MLSCQYSKCCGELEAHREKVIVIVTSEVLYRWETSGQKVCNDPDDNDVEETRKTLSGRCLIWQARKINILGRDVTTTKLRNAEGPRNAWSHHIPFIDLI